MFAYALGNHTFRGKTRKYQLCILWSRDNLDFKDYVEIAPETMQPIL